MASEGKNTKWKAGRIRFASKRRVGLKDQDTIPSARGKSFSFSEIGRKEESYMEGDKLGDIMRQWLELE